MVGSRNKTGDGSPSGAVPAWPERDRGSGRGERQYNKDCGAKNDRRATHAAILTLAEQLRRLRHRSSRLGFNSGALQKREPAGHRVLPGFEIGEEMDAIAVLVGVLELVECDVLGVKKAPVSGQEVLIDHVFQRHSAPPPWSWSDARP